MSIQHFPASRPAPSFVPTEVLGPTGDFLVTAHRCRAEIVRTDCPPVGENEVAPVVTTPAASGPRAGIRLISGLSKKAQRELSALRLLRAGLSLSASLGSTSRTFVSSPAPVVLSRRPGSGICGSCPSTPCVGCRTF